MKNYVSAMIVGLALGAASTPAVAAGWNHQGNLRVVQLAQTLAQQAAGLAQQANAQANGWGATWADRRAAQELAQFAGNARSLASSASGCMNGGNNPNPYPGNGYPNPGNGYPYPGNGQPYPGNGNPYPGNGQPYPGNGNPYPGQNPPGWPAPGHSNGGWNNGNNGGWNNGNNGGWNQDQQVGQQLERLFRDTWRQAGDVARTLGRAPRLAPLVPYWNQGVGNTLNQLRFALNCGPNKRDNVREGLFSQLFGR